MQPYLNLDDKKITEHLAANGKELFAQKIQVFKIIDSTNTYAKQVASKAIDGSVFLAEEQTAGRGRMGKTFFSPAHTGLYLSILLHNKQTGQDSIRASYFEDPGRFTTMAAVSVCRVLQDLYGLKPQIKWVNDVFVDSKKVCGILTEGVIDSKTGCLKSVVVGIGINLTTQASDFPDDIQHIASSVAMSASVEAQKKDFSLNVLAAHLLNDIAFLLTNQKREHIMQEYRSRSLVLGKKIQVLRGEHTTEALVREIDDEGHLQIEYSDGTTEILYSGEVSIKLC